MRNEFSEIMIITEEAGKINDAVSWPQGTGQASGSCLIAAGLFQLFHEGVYEGKNPDGKDAKGAKDVLTGRIRT